MATGLALLLGGCSGTIDRFSAPSSFAFQDPASVAVRPSVAMSTATGRDTGAEAGTDAGPGPMTARATTWTTATDDGASPAAIGRPYTGGSDAGRSGPGPSETGRSDTGRPWGETTTRDAVVPPAVRQRPPPVRSTTIEVSALAPPESAPVSEAPASRGPFTTRSVVVLAPAPVDAAGGIVVQPGDSLAGLAIRHGVSAAELQRINGLPDARIQPGQTLRLPRPATAASPRPAMPSRPAPSAQSPSALPQSARRPTTATAMVPPIAPTRAVATAPITPPASSATGAGAAPAPVPVVLNAPVAPATVPSSAPTAPAATAGTAAPLKLRWPATGRIVAAYGPRSDGGHNDGIAISVPQGTEVHAAEAGVVVYAGAELKGYGNLALVRHDNGWITAYAHNAELLARRGDRVRRGQVIAKAGASDRSDRPQVHFEVRQSGRPVDPLPHLERP